MNLINKPKVVIFDMDGLMLDTEIIHYKTRLLYAPKYGLDYNLSKRHLYSGMTNDEVITELSKIMDKTKAIEMRNKISEERKKIFNSSTHSIKKYGLDELLNYLDENGIDSVIASSSARERIKYFLDKESILNRFKLIVSGEDVKNSKPSPDIFLKALNLYGAKKDEALILEDSENGYLAARQSGIPYMIIPDSSFEYNKLSADITYKDLTSVIRELNKLEKRS